MLALIELWGEEGVQDQLEGCKRNKSVYERIARGMLEAGYERTGDPCRDKVKKLKGEYRKVTDSNGETGRGRKTCKFFDEMDAILGNRPATRPSVVVDTLDAADKDEEGEETKESGDEGDASILGKPGSSKGGKKEDAKKISTKRKREDRMAVILQSTMKELWEGMRSRRRRVWHTRGKIDGGKGVQWNLVIAAPLGPNFSVRNIEVAVL